MWLKSLKSTGGKGGIPAHRPFLRPPLVPQPIHTFAHNGSRSVMVARGSGVPEGAQGDIATDSPGAEEETPNETGAGAPEGQQQDTPEDRPAEGSSEPGRAGEDPWQGAGRDPWSQGADSHFGGSAWND
eukprot:7297896-Pyramimonas_sp.AAC.1